MERKPPQPLEIFYCYARKDHFLRDKLDAHLATLRHTGLITAWYDGEIVPGVSWEEEIEMHLNTADIILLLISPAFIGSDYCYSKEMKRALERHHAKEARVVPILLRPVDWAGTPFSQLEMLPSNARPVTRWPDRDEAFEDVTKGIRKVVNDLLSQRIIASDSSVPTAPTKLSQATPSPSSTGSQLLRPSQRHISRRTALIGLAGLAVVGVAGGSIAWLTRSQGPHLSSASATSTAAVRSTMVAESNMYARAVATNGVMVGFDAQHTHTNPYERILTPATVSGLKKKWVYQSRNGFTSPVVAGGVVYGGSFDYSLYAIDTASGRPKWAYQTGNIILSGPEVMNDTVYTILAHEGGTYLGTRPLR
jgi:hypothetical protein